MENTCKFGFYGAISVLIVSKGKFIMIHWIVSAWVSQNQLPGNNEQWIRTYIAFYKNSCNYLYFTKTYLFDAFFVHICYEQLNPSQCYALS